MYAHTYHKFIKNGTRRISYFSTSPTGISHLTWNATGEPSIDSLIGHNNYFDLWISINQPQPGYYQHFNWNYPTSRTYTTLVNNHNICNKTTTIQPTMDTHRLQKEFTTLLQRYSQLAYWDSHYKRQTQH